jgi:3-oxoacyl-[acyl-carrier-protein] synthase-1
MAEVFAGADNIITSLGFTTSENIKNIKKGLTGLDISTDEALSPVPLPLSLIDQHQLVSSFEQYIGIHHTGLQNEDFTRLEKMFILSIHDALSKTRINIQDKRTLLILSTTKGNIDLLTPPLEKRFERKRVYLWELARVLKDHFGSPNTPMVVSNACISGVLGIIFGKRMIKAGLYDNVIVTGGDIITDFVISGFQSFQTLSPEPCKPFDKSRNGLSLGEGCGTIIFSSDPAIIGSNEEIRVLSGACSNDANHISGPSRTGEGLYIAIRNILKSSMLKPEDIDYISAHGTATDYNDEMESKALSWAKLNPVPVNSYKGCFGHTLGAAGVIESIISLYSMKQNELLRSTGFEELGVSRKINVIDEFKEKQIKTCLKTASGFGGCNAAVIFSKY